MPFEYSSDREVIDMMGGRFEVAAEFGSGDDATVMLRTKEPPGRLVPLHNHSPECVYIVKGALEVWTPDPTPGWNRLEAGESQYLADGVNHSLRNAGDEPVDFMLLMDGRLARFFREAGHPADLSRDPEPPTPEVIHHVMEVAKRFGFWIATPDEALKIVGPSGVPDDLLTQPKG